MANTVNGTSVPGLLTNIGNSAPNTVTTSTSSGLGVKAASPNTAVPAKPNTLTTTQAAPVNDLSGSYANINGTIYNKSTGTAYSTPQQFYSASGVNSFNNLKFDTAWQPPTTTPTPTSTTIPTPAPTTTPPATPNTTLPALAATTATGAPATPPAPNNGTTGVSQGGIISGLVNNASTNPGYTTAINQAAADNQLGLLTQQNALGAHGAATNGAVQGTLASIYNAKVSNDLAQANAATSAQGATTSGLSSAASANAPILTTPGQVQLSPSQPATGSTTSGTNGLASLVGQRTGSDGKTTEFYNTQTGQGFATPQALADFINQQYPGTNANASNVFQVYDQLKQGSGNIVGGNSALNPLSQIPSIAQRVISGEESYSDALAAGGSVPGFTSALQAQISQSQPGFNFNVSQGNSTAQQQTTAQQQQLQSQYTSAKQQANNLSTQFNDLLTQYGLNPSEFNVANGAIQKIAANTSDPRYAALNNYVTDIQNTYAAILGAGGTITNDVRDTAKGMLDSLASGQSLQAVIGVLDQQAQAKIAGVQTPPNTSGGSPANSNTQTLGLF